MTTNQIAYWNLQEQQRTNRVNEGIKTREADTHEYSARETARSNRAREVETNRSNIAKEVETNRSNMAREVETHRSNKVNEGIGIANAVTGGIKNVSQGAESISNIFKGWFPTKKTAK